jgi:DNA-binding transcriptional MocR family regulator
MQKYMAILSDMEERIRTGQYGPGRKLPSIREAASLYDCSRSTIIRAYAELERQHTIYAMPQSGYYVVDKRGEQWDVRECERLDFTSASPDLNIFPYLDFQHCLNKAIDTYQYHLFTYGDSQGLESFRNTLASHLASDQVFAKPDQIVVTSGVTQALMILTQMPFPNHKSVILVEQPGYDIYLRYLEMEGAPVESILRTSKGIDLDRLEKLFKHGNIKFFFTMPRYQNPLGVSYNLAERKAIVALAAKYDVYIVEDDYMGDLGSERRLHPLHSYDDAEHVIYLKSFSKIIFPGLRIGAAVVPRLLLPTFRMYKKYADSESSLLSQAALEIYIKNGMFERHKHKIVKMYASRMKAMNDALLQHNASGIVEPTLVQSGVYIALQLENSVNMDQLIRRLAGREIVVVHSKGFYLTNYASPYKFLRLSITRVHKDVISSSVYTLMEEIKKANQNAGRKRL